MEKLSKSQNSTTSSQLLLQMCLHACMLKHPMQ